jgi:hypothetical protein
MVTPPSDTRAGVRDATGAQHRVLLFAVVVALVVLPIVIALLSLLGTHWHASSDDALEILRVRDVGGRHTPLTGVQSRFGWNHPGPVLFWGLAPFNWMFGPTGVLFGVGLLNACVLVASLFVARRRGGLAFVVILGIAVLVLLRALGSAVLIDPWNPWVAVLPFLLYLLLAWSVAERDFGALPALVAVGSFLAQTHVGYAPLVLGAGAVAGALAFVGPRDAEPDRPWWTLRRSAIVAAVVAFALWIVPVLQQLTGHPGNLGEIVRYFRHPAEAPLGLATAWGIMGTELDGAWARGNDLSVLGEVATASALPAVFLITATLAFAIAALRRGRGAVGRLGILVVACIGIGVVATARITGIIGNYLVRWWWVLGALLCASLVWSAYTLWARSRLPRLLATVGIALLALVALFASWNAVPARVPLEHVSVALEHLTPKVTQHLSREQRYLVTFVDSRDLGAIGDGLYLDLTQRGYDVKVQRDYGKAFGTWRVADAGSVDATVTVVANDDVDKGWTPPSNAEPIGRYDPLSPSERRRAQRLASTILRSLHGSVAYDPGLLDSQFGRRKLGAAGADPADVAELAALRRAGSAYTVYLVTPSS